MGRHQEINYHCFKIGKNYNLPYSLCQLNSKQNGFKSKHQFVERLESLNNKISSNSQKLLICKISHRCASMGINLLCQIKRTQLSFMFVFIIVLKCKRTLILRSLMGIIIKFQEDFMCQKCLTSKSVSLPKCAVNAQIFLSKSVLT